MVCVWIGSLVILAVRAQSDTKVNDPSQESIHAPNPLHRVMAWEQGALNNQDRQGSGLFQERQPRFRNVPEKEDQLPPGGPRRSWAGLRHWVGPVTG